MHHERFDGKGYPIGKAGADIPIGARMKRQDRRLAWLYKGVSSRLVVRLSCFFVRI